MSNNEDSDLDVNTGDIDECTVIRTQPSIQPKRASSLECLNDTKPAQLVIHSHTHETSGTNYSIGHSHLSKNSLCIEECYHDKFEIKPARDRGVQDITKRLYHFQTKVNEKVEKLAREKSDLEMKECSFKPSIFNKSKRRSIDTFLKNMQDYSEIKNRNIERLKEEQVTTINECDSQVKTLKKSIQILAKKPFRKNTFFQKQGYSVKDLNQSPSNFTFQPIINETSKNIVKHAKIPSKIFENIETRTISTKSPPSLIAKQFSSPKSDGVLIKKFDTEFASVISELDFDRSGLINYSKFWLVMKKMSFISPKPEKLSQETELLLKVWNRLGGGESSKILKKNLNNFLLAVLNLSRNSRASSNDTLTSGMRSGIISFSKEDVRKIHLEYNILCQNRRKTSPSPSRTESNKATPPKQEKRINTKKSSDKTLYSPSTPYLLSPQEFLQVNKELVQPPTPTLKESVHESTQIITVASNSADNPTVPPPVTSFSIIKCMRVSTGKSESIEQPIQEFFRPALSIPKIATKKSTSLQRMSITPDNISSHIQFTYHNSPSPGILKNSPTFSMFNSESEINDQSILINPLVTPPSDPVKRNGTKRITFTEDINNDEKETKKSRSNGLMSPFKQIPGVGKIRGSTRYKCLSPESYEDSEESILITVILPNDSEQYLRVHKDDILSNAVKNFGKKHKLDAEQMKTLQDEILLKMQ